jgi:hypothetical protein
VTDGSGICFSSPFGNEDGREIKMNDSFYMTPEH